eukprot:scaffold43195_cov206-Amphora_coffeaeformis.AAC.2
MDAVRMQKTVSALLGQWGTRKWWFGLLRIHSTERMGVLGLLLSSEVVVTSPFWGPTFNRHANGAWDGSLGRDGGSLIYMLRNGVTLLIFAACLIVPKE